MELDGRTPLEAASLPNLAALAGAERGRAGANVIPGGLPPGSDVGNLSILGYDPLEFHTGRAPDRGCGDGRGARAGRGRVPVQPRHARRRRDHGRLRGRAPVERAEPPDRRGARRRARQRARRDPLPPGRRVPPPAGDAGRLGRGLLRAAPRPHGPGRGVADRSRRREAHRADGGVAARRGRGRRAGRLDRDPDLAVGSGRASDAPAFADALRRRRPAHLRGGSRARARCARRASRCSTSPAPSAGFDNDYGAQRDACLSSLQDRDFFLLHVEATDEAGHQQNAGEKVARARVVGSRDHRPAASRRCPASATTASS